MNVFFRNIARFSSAWRRPSFYTFSPDYDEHVNKLFIIAILLFFIIANIMRLRKGRLAIPPLPCPDQNNRAIKADTAVSTLSMRSPICTGVNPQAMSFSIS